MRQAMLNEESTVGAWAGLNGARTRTLERYNLDYCCGGNRTLREACAERGLEVAEVLEALSRTQEEVTDEFDWERTSLALVCDEIERRHHGYLQKELPRLYSLFAKVVAAHGQNHPFLYEVQDVFAAFTSEVEAHLMKEEEILFPMIRSMEIGDGAAAAHCGSIRNPLRVMDIEHKNAGDALERMSSLTGRYSVPGDACPTYAALMAGLRELEEDMHLHIHRENNLLFPKAVTLEESVSMGAL